MRVIARSLLAVVGPSFLMAFAAQAILAAGTPAKITVTTPEYPHAEFGAQIVPCGVDIRLEGLVVDADDAPVESIEVAWIWEDDVDLPPVNPDDRINVPTSVTDTNGVAVSSVRLACVVGLRGVSGRTEGATHSVDMNVVSVPDPVPAPNTSIGDVPESPAPDAIAILVALAAVAGASAFLRRTVRSED